MSDCGEEYVPPEMLIDLESILEALDDVRTYLSHIDLDYKNVKGLSESRDALSMLTVELETVQTDIEKLHGGRETVADAFADRLAELLPAICKEYDINPDTVEVHFEY